MYIQEIIDFFKNHPIPITIWMILFCTIIINLMQIYFSNIKYISSKYAVQLINRSEAIVIDTRSLQEFNKGHIVNSVNIPFKIFKDEVFHKLKKYNKQTIIIVVCNHGITANENANFLVKNYFENVYVIKDGISGWEDNKLPLVYRS